ncbi:hypothetical protein [Nakamurella aerolata]|uniref:Integral membrane protein n=1 Tax=Nakamurella aerolata TaxID=1656892 RepID=A0A849ADI0_9ACTN|nr:hypothetical protein [Nakamurella aerolata]NNG34932.1 hypothetical protein [Nakamurella aerolata]
MQRPLLMLLRIVAVAHAALAIAQPLSIGQYLDGVIGALAWHGGTGEILAGTALLMSVLALLVVLRRGPRWLVVPPLTLALAEGLQIGLGFSRSLGVHIPLGVGIVATAIGYAIAVLRPSAATQRSRRADRRPERPAADRHPDTEAAAG